MEGLIYLDTHVVFWLYAEGAEARLSDAAARHIRQATDRRISPMVRLELQYLYEIERIKTPGGPIVDELRATIGLMMCDTPLAAVVAAAEDLPWTRDPFDRLITAAAELNNAPLVTKDETIREHYPRAIW